MTALLEVRNLAISLAGVPIITDVTLAVGPGEAVGLVGESGSGKSMTARAIVRALPRGADVAGSISFDGRDVPAFSPAELRGYRAREVAMIFQDPRAHINPVRTVGDFLTEGLRTNLGMSRAAATARARPSRHASARSSGCTSACRAMPGRHGWRNSWTRSAWIPGSPRPARRPCPEASGSESPSLVRWPRSRG